MFKCSGIQLKTWFHNYHQYLASYSQGPQNEIFLGVVKQEFFTLYLYKIIKQFLLVVIFWSLVKQLLHLLHLLRGPWLFPSCPSLHDYTHSRNIKKYVWNFYLYANLNWKFTFPANLLWSRSTRRSLKTICDLSEAAAAAQETNYYSTSNFFLIVVSSFVSLTHLWQVQLLWDSILVWLFLSSSNF